jgi:hypothetical protein
MKKPNKIVFKEREREERMGLVVPSMKCRMTLKTLEVELSIAMVVPDYAKQDDISYILKTVKVVRMFFEFRGLHISAHVLIGFIRINPNSTRIWEVSQIPWSAQF